MTAADPPATAWRCPHCDTRRSAEDAFCGRCGAARPAVEAGGAGTLDGSAPGGTRRAGQPIVRALVLNGIIVGAVALGLLFGRGSEPGSITFTPEPWRCDGTERTWTATLPAGAADLRLEWRSGTIDGPLLASSVMTQAALARFAGTDGSFRVSTSDASAPECRLPAGGWTLVIRDAASNALLATGPVELGSP